MLFVTVTMLFAIVTMLFVIATLRMTSVNAPCVGSLHRPVVTLILLDDAIPSLRSHSLLSSLAGHCSVLRVRGGDSCEERSPGDTAVIAGLMPAGQV